MVTYPGPVTLGTAQLGLDYGVANPDGMPSAKDAAAILEHAYALGVRSFDTAAAYGLAEERLGAFLSMVDRQTVCVTTKLAPDALDGEGPLRDKVLGAVASSLNRLGLDRVDCLLIHRPAWLDERGGDFAEALHDIKKAGLADRLGPSVYEPSEAGAWARHGLLDAIQAPFNLFDRRVVDSGLATQVRNASGWVFTRSAFLQGLFALGPEGLPGRLMQARGPLLAAEGVAQQLGISLTEAALLFALGSPDIDSVVLGVDNLAQLEANMALVNGRDSFAGADLLADATRGVEPAIFDPRKWPQAEVSP